jgi:hypothetical protein
MLLVGCEYAPLRVVDCGLTWGWGGGIKAGRLGRVRALLGACQSRDCPPVLPRGTEWRRGVER